MDERQKKEYQTVVLGALLHDIGKFMQRADVETPGFDFELWKGDLCPEGYKYQHVVWTKYFIDELIKDLPPEINKTELFDIASYHHKTDSIVREADCISSGMERYSEEKEQETYKKVRLHSIFDIVELKYKMTDPDGNFNSKYYHELKPLRLGKKNIFPVRKENLNPKYCDPLVSEYKKLWYGDTQEGIKGFIEEFRDIRPINFNFYFHSLLYLLQKYTWSIPSATNVFPDISLFDHLRTTAAIAGCLFHWEKSDKLQIQKNPFILLMADISGIQAFIYKITAAQGAGGIAKRLRGRSFYLTMLPEVIAKHIVDMLGLAIANINFCGGGVFELLLPNTKDVIEKINTLEDSINDWLIKGFYAELGFVIEKTELSKVDLMEKYGEKKIELNDLLSIKKKRKFAGKFRDDDFIVRREKLGDTVSICKSCNLSLVQKTDDICCQCNLHKKIGDTLGKAVYIVFSKEELAFESATEISFDDFGRVYLSEKFDYKLFDFIKQGLIYDVQRINDLDDPYIKGFTFLGNTLPVANNTIALKTEELKDSEYKDEQKGVIRPGQTLSFAPLSDMSIGDKKIGILKMDVDFLGYIFSMGLEIHRTEEEKKSLKSISRISTLSRQLNYFFSGYINNICSEVFEEWKEDEDNDWYMRNKLTKEDIKDIFYISYSGGDDLLIIGPWSEIPRLAQRINERFREYTCHNPNITLSAGIFICKPKYPISISARKAGDELDYKSKALGRNRITLFGETAVWDYEKGERWKDELKRSVERERSQKAVSNGRFVNVKTFGDYLNLADILYNGTKLEKNKLPRGFIHGLIMDYQRFFGDKVDPNLNIIPALLYKIIRNVKDEELKKELKAKLITEGDVLSYLRKIRLSAMYALMKSRKR